MVTKGWARAARVFAATLALSTVIDASGYDGAVEKQVFALPSYTTVEGKSLRNVRVGYETYGKLNASGDNAIFIPHFFTGTSHAAGKYEPSDAAAGYWDSMIGAGKPVDTDKNFVISADALANVNTKDPNVTATGTHANSMIYMAKANQLYNPGDDVKKLRAKILFVPAKSDLIFPPELSQRAAERYRAQGGAAEVAIIDGDGGHRVGILNVARQGDAIRALLAR